MVADWFRYLSGYKFLPLRKQARKRSFPSKVCLIDLPIFDMIIQTPIMLKGRNDLFDMASACAGPTWTVLTADEGLLIRLLHCTWRNPPVRPFEGRRTV